MATSNLRSVWRATPLNSTFSVVSEAMLEKSPLVHLTKTFVMKEINLWASGSMIELVWNLSDLHHVIVNLFTWHVNIIRHLHMHSINSVVYGIRIQFRLIRSLSQSPHTTFIWSWTKQLNDCRLCQADFKCEVVLLPPLQISLKENQSQWQLLFLTMTDQDTFIIHHHGCVDDVIDIMSCERNSPFDTDSNHSSRIEDRLCLCVCVCLWSFLLNMLNVLLNVYHPIVYLNLSKLRNSLPIHI